MNLNQTRRYRRRPRIGAGTTQRQGATTRLDNITIRSRNHAAKGLVIAITRSQRVTAQGNTPRTGNRGHRVTHRNIIRRSIVNGHRRAVR